jgi:DNA-damage-inducible protein J
MQTVEIRARINPELKKKAEDVLKDIGLSPSEALRLFYKQIELQQGLPLSLKRPNEETLAAIWEADHGELEILDMDTFLKQLK